MLSFKIRNDQFNPSLTYKYSLHLLISTKSFSIMVVSDQEDKCMVLEKYRFPKCNHPHEILANVSAFYEEINYLKIREWEKVIITLCDDKFAVVPLELFSQESTKDFLELNTVLGEDDAPMHTSYESADVVCTFALFNDLKEWWEKVYSDDKIQFHHFVGNTLQMIHNSYFENNKKTLNVILKDDQVIITYQDEDGKVKFVNQYEYGCKEDLLYYLLLALKTVEVSQQDAVVVFWGDVTQEAFDFVKEYAYKTSYGTTSETLLFNKNFEKIEDYQKFEFFASYLYSIQK